MNIEKDNLYVLVGNIPSKFHSVDLRSFFSQFIEGGKFQCFHFRHRPEVLKRKDQPGGSCQEIPPAINLNQEEPRTLKGKTTCCVVRLKEEHVKELLEVYNGENWIDKDGTLLRQKVVMSTVTVTDSQAAQVGANYHTRKEKRDDKRDRVEFVKEDLLKLSEFRPPSFMPNGNVGTSLNVFLDLIRTCQLPPHIIKKLGLSFPSCRSKHRYGNVPFDYGKDAGSVSLCTDVSGSAEMKNNGKMKNNEKKKHFECHLEDERKNQDFRECSNNSGENEDVQNEEFSKDADGTCESSELTEDSDSEPEEDWERHEALYDDVDCQARTKERLYENKIELKWEKGGSGLVFYTDAAYWDSLNGDFDEQTADDWDIDMGLYEKGGTGDRNSKALLEMRIEEQRQAGNDVDDDVTPGKVGEFEKHTKGFGGTLMKRQGWTEGNCLGASQPGITEPIPADGQNPHCKRGFGYYGKKLERHVKRKRVDRDVVISTIFDTPNEKHSTPFQSAGPFTLKYCNKVEFVPQKTKTA